MTTKNRAAIYARHSSDMQNPMSSADQIALCKALAKREGLEIVGEFSDEEKSGRGTKDRDGYNQMLEAAEHGRFDAIIVESADRLSRDLEEMARAAKHLKFCEVRIHTCNDGVLDKMKMTLRSLFSDLFIDDLSGKVRRGLVGQAKRGKLPGNPPFGYRIVTGRPGEPEIDPDKAEIVRRIFRDFVAGQSSRAIAAALNAEGIPSPRGRKWNKTVIFTKSAGHDGLLGNPIYRGEITWNRSHTVKNPKTEKMTHRANGEGDVVRASAPHLRIVDDVTWNAAQAVRRSRSLVRSAMTGEVVKRPFIARREWMLSGLLLCGSCGAPMVIYTNSRKYGSRVKCSAEHSHGTCGHSRSYYLDKLTNDVIDCMKAKLARPDEYKALVEGFHEQSADKANKHRAASRRIEKRLAGIEAAIARTVDLVEDQNIPVSVIKGKLQKLEVERIAIAEERRLLGSESNVVELLPSSVQAYAKAIDGMHRALTSGTEAAANARQYFRELVAAVKVFPAPKFAPNEIEVLWKPAALAGAGLYDSGKNKKAFLPVSDIDQIVSLGRWKAAAA